MMTNVIQMSPVITGKGGVLVIKHFSHPALCPLAQLRERVYKTEGRVEAWRDGPGEGPGDFSLARHQRGRTKVCRAAECHCPWLPTGLETNAETALQKEKARTAASVNPHTRVRCCFRSG